MIKNPPALQEMQETRVRSLGREDPTEEGMATHSSILSWKIPWTEEPGGLRFMGSQKLRHYLVTKPPPPYVPNDVDDNVHRNIACIVAILETMQLYIHKGIGE